MNPIKDILVKSYDYGQVIEVHRTKGKLPVGLYDATNRLRAKQLVDLWRQNEIHP